MWKPAKKLTINRLPIVGAAANLRRTLSLQGWLCVHVSSQTLITTWEWKGFGLALSFGAELNTPRVTFTGIHFALWLELELAR